MKPKCAKEDCKKAAFPGQKYCSRDCAPLAKLYGGSSKTKTASSLGAAATPIPPALQPMQEKAEPPFDGRFGQLLKKARQETGIDLKRLRELTGAKTVNTLVNIEQGKFDRLFQAFCMLARYCSVSLDQKTRNMKVKTPAQRKADLQKEKILKRIARDQAKLKEIEAQEVH